LTLQEYRILLEKQGTQQRYVIDFQRVKSELGIDVLQHRINRLQDLVEGFKEIIEGEHLIELCKNHLLSKLQNHAYRLDDLIGRNYEFRCVKHTALTLLQDENKVTRNNRGWYKLAKGVEP